MGFDCSALIVRLAKMAQNFEDWHGLRSLMHILCKFVVRIQTGFSILWSAVGCKASLLHFAMSQGVLISLQGLGGNDVPVVGADPKGRVSLIAYGYPQAPAVRTHEVLYSEVVRFGLVWDQRNCAGNHDRLCF